MRRDGQVRRVVDLVIMYKAFQERGLLVSDEDRAATERILQRAPRSSDEFARETAATWRGATTARTAGA
jgi:hypothetical protein